MKYGDHFEKESVPQWSLHNIDYNSLKHHIKAHTVKDQATAIAIPGRPNTALARFENDFYSELCRQHDRVDLFVTSKADEIARRLQHLSSQIHRLILRCATSGHDRIPIKRRQRFARYEQKLVECGDDIRSLERFVNAQVVAFRKILKKYKKWTGSSTLGSRFRENVLSDPKSFTRRDFSHLHTRHDDLLETLHAALPAHWDDVGAVPARAEERQPPRPSSAELSPSETVVAPESQPSAGYWNEYECGSEAGDLDRGGDTGYALYIDPNADDGFLGIRTLGRWFTVPIKHLAALLYSRPREGATAIDPERGPLLDTHSTASPYGSSRSPADRSYFTIPPGGAPAPATAAGTETDLDDEPGSSRQASTRHSRRNSASLPLPRSRGYGGAWTDDDRLFFLPEGYSAHTAAFSLPSITEQRVARYRERVLRWGAWACFAVALVLTCLAAVLITAGRHRMRLEVDAGVTIAIVTSLGLACAGLCMTGSRRDKIALLARLAVWLIFAATCVTNGVLLVLVMGNTAS